MACLEELKTREFLFLDDCNPYFEYTVNGVNRHGARSDHVGRMGG